MTRLRSLVSSISPAALIVPLVLTALLSWQAMTAITWQFDQAHLCAVDWQQAIDALESGASEYNGNCVGLSIGEPGREIPEDFYQQRDRAWEEFAAASARLTDNPWRQAANQVAGSPLAFFALFAGAMVAGSPLGSAVAAWGLSNGWTRPVWARSVLSLTVLAVVSAFVLATAMGVVITYLRVSAAGVASSFPVPTLDALGPLAGLLYYAMVGTAAGLLTGRGEVGGMVAIVFAVADFMAASRFGLSPFFPSSWHQTILGAEASPLSKTQALAAVLSVAVIGAGLVYWFMTRRRDVPDR